MFGWRKFPVLQTGRLTLRLPQMGDYMQWATLRRESESFLAPWEPLRDPAYLSRRAFRYRVNWGRAAVLDKRSLPLLLIRRADRALLGGITLDNMQGGVAKSCTVGYWMGERFARNGYMAEALEASVRYAFDHLDISRIQAGCLPENTPSRSLLEKSGFKYEGVAQSYLQIAGRWRDHVLYANLRQDRQEKGMG